MWTGKYKPQKLMGKEIAGVYRVTKAGPAHMPPFVFLQMTLVGNQGGNAMETFRPSSIYFPLLLFPALPSPYSWLHPVLLTPTLFTCHPSLVR